MTLDSPQDGSRMANLSSKSILPAKAVSAAKNTIATSTRAEPFHFMMAIFFV